METIFNRMPLRHKVLVFLVTAVDFCFMIKKCIDAYLSIGRYTPFMDYIPFVIYVFGTITSVIFWISLFVIIKREGGVIWNN